MNPLADHASREQKTARVSQFHCSVLFHTVPVFHTVVRTTTYGIMDHEEARRKHVGGKIVGFFF